MNNQLEFYKTALAPHIPHHKTGRRSMSASRIMAAPYGSEEVPGFVLDAGSVSEIDPGPFHPGQLHPCDQTQAELVSRLSSMNAELTAYVDSLPKGERWTYNQLATIARLWDLMELEHSLCDAPTVELLRVVHDVDPGPTSGDVVGRYAEFSLKPPGHCMI
ncbi:MAG: hypothetical protein JKX78_02980 [Alteromonadaceae bacterium]|nr:hypothetical protein [Alteromonadaceae bacterium]